jgi:hypothetical protein
LSLHRQANHGSHKKKSKRKLPYQHGFSTPSSYQRL